MRGSRRILEKWDKMKIEKETTSRDVGVEDHGGLLGR